MDCARFSLLGNHLVLYARSVVVAMCKVGEFSLISFTWNTRKAQQGYAHLSWNRNLSTGHEHPPAFSNKDVAMSEQTLNTYLAFFVRRRPVGSAIPRSKSVWLVLFPWILPSHSAPPSLPPRWPLHLYPSRISEWIDVCDPALLSMSIETTEASAPSFQTFRGFPIFPASAVVKSFDPVIGAMWSSQATS